MPSTRTTTQVEALMVVPTHLMPRTTRHTEPLLLPFAPQARVLAVVLRVPSVVLVAQTVPLAL